VTTIQIIGVQHPGSRRGDYVRAFGVVPKHRKQQTVEIAVSVDEAFTMMRQATTTGAFPQVTVEDDAWVFCLNPGDTRIMHAPEQVTTP